MPTLRRALCGIALLTPAACHHDLDAVARPQADAGGDAAFVPMCPPDYVHVGDGYYYRFVKLPAEETFPIAQADCANDRLDPGSPTHLAVIADPMNTSELGILGGAAMSAGVASLFWIGLSKKTTDWQWVTDELPAPVAPPGFPWDSSDPHAQGDNCALIQKSTNLFVDVPCTTDLYEYACECDAYPPNPSHF